MGKHLTYEELAIYSEHLKSNSLKQCPETIRKHVEECDRCAVEAAELSLLIDDKAATGGSKINLSLFTGKKIWFASAAAAGLLIMLSLWFMRDTPQPAEHYSAQNTANILDTTQSDTNTEKQKIALEQLKENLPDSPNKPNRSKSPEILIGVSESNEQNSADDNFITHEPTEMLAQSFNANMRGEQVEIISPSELRVSRKDSIVLRWRNPRNKMLTAELLLNSAETYDEYQSPGDSVIIESLPHKGLFYWKLFNRDFDLIFCGKILYE